MNQETSYRIEPCLLSNPPVEVVDLLAALSSASQRLVRGLHPRTAAGLADLVRIMNCYYSNLIEGHNTTPREIERALSGQLDDRDDRRNLQLEAKAHIRIQRLIDEQAAAGTLPEPASIPFIRWLHREFYAEVPAAMLEIEGSGRRLTMTPGKFRDRPEEDVSVGRHLPPSSGQVDAFMAYFETQYRFQRLGQGGRIMAMAAAHHRLNYIHPFPDGNGRVSRLMSHAMGLQAGIGAHGLWSVSRGLARGLESRGDYKRMMDQADTPRQNDLDGRGNLSLKALEAFVAWFLKVCLDQVTFMESLFRLESLSTRLKRYQEVMAWKPEAACLLEAALLKGELQRGEAARVTGMKERSARLLLSTLVEDGILASDTPKGPVRLKFPVHSVEILFPRLFPEA
jgi:Fic family protein